MNKMTRAEKQKARLRNYTTEWASLENYKRKYYREQWLANNLETETIQTLYIIQDRIDHLVFQIVRKVDWFRRNDEDFDNEIACRVYDKYASELQSLG